MCSPVKSATASDLPSGDSANVKIPFSPAGMGRRLSRVRWAGGAAGLIRNRKNWVTGSVPWPCAATTKVRSAAAPVTPAKVTYGLGGAIVASTAPVAVSTTAARVTGTLQHDR